MTPSSTSRTSQLEMAGAHRDRPQRRCGRALGMAAAGALAACAAGAAATAAAVKSGPNNCQISRQSTTLGRILAVIGKCDSENLFGLQQMKDMVRQGHGEETSSTQIGFLTSYALTGKDDKDPVAEWGVKLTEFESTFVKSVEALDEEEKNKLKLYRGGGEFNKFDTTFNTVVQQKKNMDTQPQVSSWLHRKITGVFYEGNVEDKDLINNIVDQINAQLMSDVEKWFEDKNLDLIKGGEMLRSKVSRVLVRHNKKYTSLLMEYLRRGADSPLTTDSVEKFFVAVKKFFAACNKVTDEMLQKGTYDHFRVLIGSVLHYVAQRYVQNVEKQASNEHNHVKTSGHSVIPADKFWPRMEELARKFGQGLPEPNDREVEQWNQLLKLLKNNGVKNLGVINLRKASSNLTLFLATREREQNFKVRTWLEEHDFQAPVHEGS